MTRRVAETAGAREAAEADEKARCEWRTGEARCFLTVGGIRGGRGYCDWHLFCLTRTVVATAWEEFARFHDHARSYCCELTHWPIDRLWKAAQGQENLRREDRRPCSLSWCRHADMGKILVGLVRRGGVAQPKKALDAGEPS